MIPMPFMVIGIGVLIAVYIYFLPLSDKCLLIPDLPQCEKGFEEKAVSVSPGFLEPKETSKRYNFPAAELFRIDNIDIATVFNEEVVERGWFFSDAKESEFTAHEGGKEIRLFIFVNSGKGSLNVIVNGRTVSTVRGEGVKEVAVPLGMLKNKNTLKLAASVPLMPWNKNSYSIGKVVIREAYTKTHNRVFYSFELKQDPHEVTEALLNFDTECFSDDNLTVMLNGETVAEGKICFGFKKDVKKYLKTDNTFTFSSDGNYIVKNIYVDVSMKGAIWPTYYFEMPGARLQSKAPIMLKLYFNETGKKDLSVYINGEPISAETNKLEWKTTINKFLVEGQNSMMFIPKTEVILDKAEVE